MNKFIFSLFFVLGFMGVCIGIFNGVYNYIMSGSDWELYSLVTLMGLALLSTLDSVHEKDEKKNQEVIIKQTVDTLQG